MIKTEKKTVGRMVYLYCRAKHGTTGTLCAKCEALNKYAQRRLSVCRFGDGKPTCEKCPVHCYDPQMREQIQVVMRFAGPRMLFRHPLLAISHILRNLKS